MTRHEPCVYVKPPRVRGARYTKKVIKEPRREERAKPAG